MTDIIRKSGVSRMGVYNNYKSKEEIIALSERVCGILLSKRIKALVIACNTATAAAAQTLRAEHPEIPIIGMEPAIKPAALSAPHPKVLIMATETTLRLEKFNVLRQQLSKEAQFIPLPCPGLVDRIEKGEIDTPQTEEFLKNLLDGYLTDPPDCVVLGCTHYPFVSPLLKRLFGEKVQLFDGSAGTARQLQRKLCELQLSSPEDRRGRVSFLCSDPSGETVLLMQKLFAL